MGKGALRTKCPACKARFPAPVARCERCGTVFVSHHAQPKKQRRSWAREALKTLLTLSVLIVGVVAGGLFLAQRDRAASEPSARDIAKAAYAFCQPHVKERLKAPSTAEFPSFDYKYQVDGRTVTIVSYVDAQNAFGATIRANYVCKAAFSGDDPFDFRRWRLLSVSFLEK